MADPLISRTQPARGRFWFAIVGCGALVALGPQSFHIERRLETAAHIDGSEAGNVSRQLAERFQSPFVQPAVLVIQGAPAPDSVAGRQVLTRIVAVLHTVAGVSGVISRLDRADPIFLGKGGGTFVIVGLAPAGIQLDALIPKLRSELSVLRSALLPRHPALTLELTGETALNFDLRTVSAGNVRDAEIRVLPATLLLLVFAFRSFIAAVLPLGVALLAIAMTLGGTALLSNRWHLSILIQNVATMLGLGLGIDYALLMVSRFREALLGARSPSDAANIAARKAGHTLLVSAAAVAVGFAALLTVPINEIRSIGVAGFLIAAACLLLTNSILPLALARLGNRINATRISVAGNSKPAQPAERRRWEWWGRVVTGHPWKSLLLAAAPMLLLASQATRLQLGLPRGDWLPPAAESVRALHSLESMQRAGIVQSLRVILELPAASSLTTDSGWAAMNRLSRHLQMDTRAERVISLSTLAGEGSGPGLLAFLPDQTLRTYLRGDRQATLLEVVPASFVSASEQIRWVRELRLASASELSGVPGATILIGGIPAFNADYDSVVRARLPKVIALVIGGSFLALLLAFRSLFASVKAIALNLLSVAAAFGALVLVFQDGHNGGVIGGGAMESIFPIVPILAFAIVFGLSMDYEVFIVARVLEARRSGLNEADAIVEGLVSTGGLITNAAAIMVVVFAAFTLGDFMLIKMLGFTLAVAVLLDATLVRMVIGPALLRLAGDWNWWPWGLAGTARDSHPRG